MSEQASPQESEASKWLFQKPGCQGNRPTGEVIHFCSALYNPGNSPKVIGRKTSIRHQCEIVAFWVIITLRFCMVEVS